MFNVAERTPSMSIFAYKNTYVYKDFSTGKGGGGIHLVMELFKLCKEDAITKIKIDFKKNKSSNTPIITSPIIYKESKIKVTKIIKRKWNTLDKYYWGQYSINSNLLEKYCVVPLKSCTFQKIINGEIKSFTIALEKMYGYFKLDGTLYKLYTPGKKNKFLTLDHYIPGIEHLEYKAPTLIITSSLKDILSILTLQIDVEVVAPTAEGILIDKRLLIAFSFKYDNIYTLFDNDIAGNKAMIKYKENYSIPSLYLTLEKDISDSVKKYGIEITKNHIKNLLNDCKTNSL